MSTTTKYELAVHLANERPIPPRLKRIIRINGLVHPDKGTALIAARNIKRSAGALVEWVNVSRARYEHIARV